MKFPRLLVALPVLVAAAGAHAADAPVPAVAVPDLVQRIRQELGGPLTDDSKPKPGVPHGEFLEGTISDSKIYPGTENSFKVYVPAQYDPAQPACLLLRLDGLGQDDPIVFDNLMASGEMPVTIAVGISSGTIWKTRGSVAYRWNRSYEFDSLGGNFPRFVLDELLPRVEGLTTHDGRPLHLSHEAKDRAVTGGSTGGIGSFTLAWERPDSFSRVYSVIGTYVSMRGGNDYPAIIRKTEPKPIRIFLEDGSTDAWNPLFGSWFMANENMEAALTFSGYDVEHAWGVHGHAGLPGNVILPDVMRWLWRGWPAPVQAGRSANDMLVSILQPGEGWQKVAGDYASATALATGSDGRVYFDDGEKQALCSIGPDGRTAPFSADASGVRSLACGPDGTLYATVPDQEEIVSLDGHGARRKVAGGIRGDSLIVSSAGDFYVVEPGRHAEERAKIWRIRANGERTVLDASLTGVSGIAFLPDYSVFFAAKRDASRIFSFVSANGRLEDGEPNYWLHPPDGPDDGGTEQLAVDVAGDLYAATPLGLQVCDRNGRVRAILWLPSPAGPIKGVCWGGPSFDMLYATDGTTVFRRHMKVAGCPPSSAPVELPRSSGG